MGVHWEDLGGTAKEDNPHTPTKNNAIQRCFRWFHVYFKHAIYLQLILGSLCQHFIKSIALTSVEREFVRGSEGIHNLHTIDLILY